MLHVALAIALYPATPAARLGAPEWRTREAATRQLQKLGPLAVPFLAPYERSEDAEVRDRALTLLKPFRIAQRDASAIRRYLGADGELPLQAELTDAEWRQLQTERGAVVSAFRRAQLIDAEEAASWMMPRAWDYTHPDAFWGYIFNRPADEYWLTKVRTRARNGERVDRRPEATEGSPYGPEGD